MVIFWRFKSSKGVFDTSNVIFGLENPYLDPVQDFSKKKFFSLFSTFSIFTNWITIMLVFDPEYKMNEKSRPKVEGRGRGQGHRPKS